MTETTGKTSELRGIPASGRLAFTAYRNGTVLGAHEVVFQRDGETLNVDIAIDYSVKLGFITVFRYTLRAREIWVGAVLQSITANTDNNGKPEFMRATREGAALMVEGTRAPRYQAPEGTILCAHWNPLQLEVPLINPQDGTLLQFDVQHRGAATLTDGSGVPCDAQRYSMLGNNAIDVWYSDDGVWLGLQAKAQDGSNIVYKGVC